MNVTMVSCSLMLLLLSKLNLLDRDEQTLSSKLLLEQTVKTECVPALLSLSPWG